MKRFTLALRLTCIMALVAAAGCSDPLQDKPEAVVGDAVEVVAPPASGEDGETPAAAPAGDETVYMLTSDSYVGFAGSKPGGVHYGQFAAFEGSASVTGGDLETTSVHLTIDATSLTTDDTVLTGTLKGTNFFDVKNYGQAIFNSTSVVKADDGYTVNGNLTIRGITKGVSFPAQISLEDGVLKVMAEFTIDRNEWSVGVGWTQSIINDGVLIELDVEAKAAP